MHNQELVNYIKEQRAKGIGNEAIRNVLSQAGWQENDVSAAFAALAPNTSPIQSISMQPITPAQSRQHLEQSIMPQTQASFPSDRLASIGDLISFAVETLHAYWKTLLGIELVSTGIFILFLGVLFIMFLILFGTTPFTANEHDIQILIEQQINTANGLVIIVVFLVAIVSVVIVQLWSYLALISALLWRHEHLGIKGAYQKAIGKTLPFLGMSILGGLAIMGGFILLIIPGIIIALWFSMSTYILLQENTGAIGSLRRSREYMRKRKWAVLSRLGAMGFIFMAINIALNMVTKNMGQINGMLASMSSITFAIISNIIEPLLSITYSVGLYESLKATSGCHREISNRLRSAITNETETNISR